MKFITKIGLIVFSFLFLFKMRIEEQNEMIAQNIYNIQTEIQSIKSTVDDIQFEVDDMVSDLDNAKQDIQDLYWQ
jgi:peptidoglycan hydrolase CwlO-like protein